MCGRVCVLGMCVGVFACGEGEWAYMCVGLCVGMCVERDICVWEHVWAMCTCIEQRVLALYSLWMVVRVWMGSMWSYGV